MLNGNKGEWGEIYAFCYLLASGILQSADKDLNPIEGVYFPIIRIIREEIEGTQLSYCPGNRIRILKDGALYKEYDRAEFDSMVNTLYREIPLGSKSFTIPETDDFFNKIEVQKLKANSAHKQDIDIEIRDIHTGITPVCGFSIKSFLGSNPTLINAEYGTNFIYRVEGCDDEKMDAFNGIATRNKLIDRMNYLQNSDCELVFSGMLTSGQFRTNMKFVDTLMPDIMAEALLCFYSSGVGSKKLSDVIDEISREDRLQLGSADLYKYKVKQLLCACALGMTPAKIWTGEEDANGGYITVKRDGSVVCYHIYDRQNFLQYLYDYTYFEKGSSSRHKYMQIYKSNGEYYLNLNLQVRFLEV